MSRIQILGLVLMAELAIVLVARRWLARPSHIAQGGLVTRVSPDAGDRGRLRVHVRFEDLSGPLEAISADTAGPEAQRLVGTTIATYRDPRDPAHFTLARPTHGGFRWGPATFWFGLVAAFLLAVRFVP